MDPLEDDSVQTPEVQATEPLTFPDIIVVDDDVAPPGPTTVQDNALVDELLAQEALRMVNSGTIPEAGPAPSADLSERVRAQWAATEASLRDKHPANFMLSNDHRNADLTRTLCFYGEKGGPGLMLAEGIVKLHWSEAHDQELIANQPGLARLEQMATKESIRHKLLLSAGEAGLQKRGV